VQAGLAYDKRNSTTSRAAPNGKRQERAKDARRVIPADGLQYNKTRRRIMRELAAALSPLGDGRAGRRAGPSQRVRNRKRRGEMNE